MSGTRASIIRDNLVTALEGATLDARVGVFDRLKFLNLARRPRVAAERCFRCNISAGPQRDTLQTCDAWKVEHQIEIYYSICEDIETRIADDAERYWWRLETLQNINPYVMIPAPSSFGLEETETMFVYRVSMVTAYRIDSAVLAL